MTSNFFCPYTFKKFYRVVLVDIALILLNFVADYETVFIPLHHDITLWVHIG